MADKFYAETRIKHGKRTEDGSQEGKYESKTFEPGEEVTGLSKEDMTDLWKAGALRRQEQPSDTSAQPDENTLNSGAAAQLLKDGEAKSTVKAQDPKNTTTASSKTSSGRTSSGS